MWLDLLVTGIAAAVCWVCVFGEQGQYSASPSPWSLTTNILYNALTKIAFSVGLGVICMMCVSGSARFINWFLTWWVWNPLARLTFGAYLVHPMLMVSARFAFDSAHRSHAAWLGASAVRVKLFFTHSLVSCSGPFLHFVARGLLLGQLFHAGAFHLFRRGSLHLLCRSVHDVGAVCSCSALHVPLQSRTLPRRFFVRCVN